MKRLFDVLVAAAGLLILWPALAFVALAVRCTLGSPILYRQQRPGLQDRPFELLKFRTMQNLYDSQNHILSDEERLTQFGTLLRRASLEELPQLINVLRGDMSLVGPRPLLMEYLPLYSAEQARRHEVRPGITGWAQVNGRNALSWEEKFALDVWYVDHQSFMLDMKILWLTILNIIRPRGSISQAGHATMPKFTGNKLDGH